MNFKYINIGTLIKLKIIENNMEMKTICYYFGLKEAEIEEMLKQESLSSEVLLKWCKLLKYDFFRIYSQHLLLFSPVQKKDNDQKEILKEHQFRKHIYTEEIIGFILTQLRNGKITRERILNDYRIPKVTLYKWLTKYKAKELIFFERKR